MEQIVAEPLQRIGREQLRLGQRGHPSIRARPVRVGEPAIVQRFLCTKTTDTDTENNTNLTDTDKFRSLACVPKMAHSDPSFSGQRAQTHNIQKKIRFWSGLGGRKLAHRACDRIWTFWRSSARSTTARLSPSRLPK